MKDIRDPKDLTMHDVKHIVHSSFIGVTSCIVKKTISDE